MGGYQDIGYKRPGGVRRVLRGNGKPRAGNLKRSTREKPDPQLVVQVVVRRWRYERPNGIPYTREFRRVMTMIGRWQGHVDARHWICEGSRYDGSPYDMMEVKFYGLASLSNKVPDRGRNSRPAPVRADIKGKGSRRRRGTSISPTT